MATTKRQYIPLSLNIEPFQWGFKYYSVLCLEDGF